MNVNPIRNKVRLAFFSILLLNNISPFPLDAGQKQARRRDHNMLKNERKLLDAQSIQFVKRNHPVVLRGHRDDVLELAFRPHSRMLVSTSNNGGEFISWDVDSASMDRQTKQNELGRGVAFGAGGRLMATAAATPWAEGFAGTVMIRDFVTGHEVPIRATERWSFNTVAVDPGGLFVAVSSQRQLRVLNLRNPVLVGKKKNNVTFNDVMPPAPGFSDEITTLDWHPTRDVIAVGCRNGDLRLVRVGNGVDVLDTRFTNDGGTLGHRSKISSVSFHPDGNYLISSSEGGSICIWDVNTGKLVDKPVQTTSTFAVSFSPSGNLVFGQKSTIEKRASLNRASRSRHTE